MARLGPCWCLASGLLLLSSSPVAAQPADMPTVKLDPAQAAPQGDANPMPLPPSCRIWAEKAGEGEILLKMSTQGDVAAQGDAPAVLLDAVGIDAKGGERKIPVARFGKELSVVPILGSVTGPGGSAVCAVIYSLKSGTDSVTPSCALEPVEQKPAADGNVSFTLKTQGDVTTMAFRDKELPPQGQLTWKASGPEVVTVTVKGPQGFSSCSARVLAAP